MSSDQLTGPRYPRIAISYCTQCRWMLRAAYFGQELLSTFSTAIGEIALIPATGGLFTVKLTYQPVSEQGEIGDAREVLLWDRKSEGGFPETKVLKQRLRDHIEPGRDLGHSDKKKHVAAIPNTQEDVGQATVSVDAGVGVEQESQSASTAGKGTDACEDCK